MTLEKRGKYWFGDNHEDIRTELSRYSHLNGYPIDDFADVRCQCGHDEFHFFTDEDEGVAIRQCAKCSQEHFMGDHAEFAEDADAGQHDCLCEGNIFQITAGVHRYRNQDDSTSNDVRWLYRGCRCIQCGLVGCYADWKNEFNGYETLLALM